VKSRAIADVRYKDKKRQKKERVRVTEKEGKKGVKREKRTFKEMSYLGI
jgi:hypothetical protein